MIAAQVSEAIHRFEHDDRARRLALAVGVAVSIYVSAVGFDAPRYGAVIAVSALPCSLVVVWFLSRPAIAIALNTTGVELLLVTNYNGSSPGLGAVIAQSTIVLTIFGAVADPVPLNGRLAILLGVGFVVVVAARSGLPLFALFVGAVCAVGYVAGLASRQVRRNGEISNRLKTSQEHGRVVAQDVAVEQERNRVAREVHDVVAHSLAVVIAQADGARYAAATDPASVGPALEAIADTARSSLGEVRTLLHHLRHSGGSTPPTLSDVDALIDSMRELGLDIELSTFGRQRVLGDVTQLAVFRLVQEALTNALRHGDPAQPVSVEYDWGDRTLTVVVTNAIPKEYVPQTDASGHGIPGMRERALLAGGDLTVGPGARGLFRVRATVPAPTDGGRTAQLSTVPAPADA